MSDTYLILTSLVAVVFVIAISVFLKIGKNNTRVEDSAEEYEDEDLTITLLNNSNYIRESDFK